MKLLRMIKRIISEPSPVDLKYISFSLLIILAFIINALFIAVISLGRTTFDGVNRLIHEISPLNSLTKETIIIVVLCIVLCSIFEVFFLFTKNKLTINHPYIDRFEKILLFTLLFETVFLNIFVYLTDYSTIKNLPKEDSTLGPRSSGYVIPMSVIAECYPQITRKVEILYIMCKNGNKHGAANGYDKELFADYKNSASECNESSLSNCRAQPILSKS